MLLFLLDRRDVVAAIIGCERDTGCPWQNEKNRPDTRNQRCRPRFSFTNIGLNQVKHT